MNEFKKLLAGSLIVLSGYAGLKLGVPSASAFTVSDAQTVFTAYNSAFLVGGYYNGWWTGAEEIEMAEDAYDNSPTTARLLIVSNACNQFVANHGSNWIVSGGNFDKYNDDVSWAVIAFARGYMITGSTFFRSVAKTNWDGMYARAWDTNFAGGGLWWNTDNAYKNAAVEGPGAISALLLFKIYGDSNYLAKAQAIYGWERQVLLNTNNGSIADGINAGSTTTSGGPTTYNQGTFIGAANLLFRYTGLPIYYQDAMLVGKYTQNSMTSGGILPEYSSASDLSGFNGIFCRWMARFAKDQNVWADFGPWLTTNANAAWSVRNSNNLCWQKWKTPLGTNVPDSWGCSAAVIVMQVSDPSPGDALKITPTGGFTAVTPQSVPPAPNTLNFTLTNIDVASLNWALSSTSAWLSVSANNGTLAAGTSTSVLVSLIPSATTNLPAGRYTAAVVVTNLTSGIASTRLFTLVLAGGDAPIAMTGYNAGILAPNTATSATPGATPLDIPNNYSFFQAGLPGATRGLPPDGVFTSMLDGKTVFQFQPYGGTNAVVVGYNYPNSVTLTLASPLAYNSLSVLATSANGSGTGTMVLNFTNGTSSQALNFTALDWFTATTNLALYAVGRLKLGASFAAEDNGALSPHLYQTTINLAALGLNQAIGSITITKPSGAGAQQDTAVFGISGTTMPDAPNIVQQPVSVTNTAPAIGAGFTVVASGLPPLSYQWYFSSNDTPGTYLPLASQTNAGLALPATLQSSNAGSYYVVVANTNSSFAAATSSVATLTLFRAPVITQQPSPAELYRLTGATSAWSVAVNAALPVTYSWRLNGNGIPGASSSTYQISNLQTNNSGSYSVVIQNGFGGVTSSVVSLTVAPASYPFKQAIFTDHALACWRLDETSGTIAHDYLGGKNGLYTPTVLLGQTGDKLIDTHPAARFGSLASTNSCVTNIPLDFSTSGNANFSVEAWVNGGTQTTDAGIVTRGYGSGGEQFNLDCGGGSHGFRFFVRDAAGNVHAATSSTTPNNQWQHVVGVCNESNGVVLLYVNGVSNASGTITPYTGLLSASVPMSIGSREAGAGTSYNNQFVGLIEEVAIYGYALTSNQVMAHFLTASNRAPTFVSNPFTAAGANAGQAYGGSLASFASDPNGDTMTFSKLSGPAWLSVAANGAMSGTPLSPDDGTNVFSVHVVDPGGLSSTATMNLAVTPAPPLVISVAVQGTNLLVSWTGGIAPWQPQWATDLSGTNWQNLGSALTSNFLYVTPVPGDTNQYFFRVYGQ